MSIGAISEIQFIREIGSGDGDDGNGASDTTPDAFTFTDVTDADLSTEYTSNEITVAGIDAAAEISITGGTYSINGGAFTADAGTVEVGDTVEVKVTSSGSHETAVNAVLTIGGVQDTYSVTTAAAPAAAVSYIESATHTLSENDWSSTRNFGVADATRVLIIVVTSRDTTTSNVTNVDAGGIAGTLRLNVGFGGNRAVSIWTVPVPTGTAGTVRVRAGNTLDIITVHIYRAVNLTSAVPTDTATSTTNPNPSVAIDVNANGFVVAGWDSDTEANAAAWTGIDEDYDQAVSTQRISAAHKSFAEAQTGLTVTVTHTGATSQRLAAAAWS